MDFHSLVWLDLNLKSVLLMIRLNFWFIDDKAIFLISEFQSHSSYLWLLYNPCSLFPAGLVCSRTVFLISCCSVKLWYTCVSSPLWFQKKRLIPPEVLSMFWFCCVSFLKQPFIFAVRLKGGNLRSQYMNGGKGPKSFRECLWETGNASFLTGEKRVKDCTIKTVCGLTVLGILLPSSSCAVPFVIVIVGKIKSEVTNLQVTGLLGFFSVLCNNSKPVPVTMTLYWILWVIAVTGLSFHIKCWCRQPTRSLETSIVHLFFNLYFYLQRASLLSCVKEDKIWSDMTTKDTQWLHSLTVFNRQMRVWSVADNFGGGGSYEIIIFGMFLILVVVVVICFGMFFSDWRELGGEMMGYFVF